MERGSFSAGLMSGTWEVFYPDGTRKTQTAYKDGLKHGCEILYDESGNLSQKCDYTNGIMNGRWEKYIGGVLVEKGAYSQGKKDGEWIFYSASGAKQRQQGFKNGRPHGKWTEYYSADKKASEGEYKEGLKHGTWKNYDRNGKVLSTTIFSEGQKIKETISDKTK